MTDIESYVLTTNILILCKTDKTIADIAEYFDLPIRKTQRYVKALLEKEWLVRSEGTAFRSTGVVEKTFAEGVEIE